MNGEIFERKLIEFRAAHSGYDEHRNYVGLSGAGDCAREIHRRYVMATPADENARLKTALAYDIEDAVRRTLVQMDLYLPSREISAWDGLVRGHTDGELKTGELIDIKTVPLDEHLPANLPRRVLFQLNAYMLYADPSWPRAYAIYVSRESGRIRVLEANRNEGIAARIQMRLEKVMAAIAYHYSPQCDCGRCDVVLGHRERTC